MGLLEDRLAQATDKSTPKGKGDEKEGARRGTSLGSIMKEKTRTQLQKRDDEEQK